MSSMTIDSTSFSLVPLTADAYELHVHFLNEQREPVSKKKFTFIQNHTPTQGKVWDVFTKNGLCQPLLLDHLFSKQDLKEAVQASHMLPKSCPIGPLVAVLDLKDPHTKYSPSTTCEISIPQGEELVCDFLQRTAPPLNVSTTAKKAHAILHTQLPIDFVLLEGTLKMDLLDKGGFAGAEVDYFHNQKSGVLSFCQCAEYFMNAFKLGQTCRSEANQFPGARYFRCISSPGAEYTPYSQHTTLYPPLYKGVYTVSGAYAQSLSPVFSVEGACDELTDFSRLTVGGKP